FSAFNFFAVLRHAGDPCSEGQQLRRGLALPLALEVDHDGLLVILVANHIDQGAEGLAVAVVDVVSGTHGLVEGNSSGSVGRVRFDALVGETHFPVEMHVVKGHAAPSVALAMAARATVYGSPFRMSSSMQLDSPFRVSIWSRR